MGEPFDTWLVVLSVALVAGLSFVGVQAFRGWRGWGVVQKEGPTIGDGAYRAGSTTLERLRGAPPLVVAGAVAATLWGLVTLVVFVPAGALLTAVTLDGAGPGGWVAVIAAVATLSGVVLGLALPRAASRLLRRKDRSIEDATWASRFSAIHHVMIWIGFTLAGFLLDDGGGYWAILLAIPCGLGLGASALLRAGRDQARTIIDTATPA